MHDPRVKVGVGMGFAVSSYGADHMAAAHDPLFVDENSFMFQAVKPLGIYHPMSSTEITPDKVRSYMRVRGANGYAIRPARWSLKRVKLTHTGSFAVLSRAAKPVQADFFCNEFRRSKSFARK